MEYLNDTKHEEKEEAGREEATSKENQNAAYSGGRDTHTHKIFRIFRYIMVNI